MFTLEGKVALITGGASGIGLACVQEFLKNGVKGVTFVDVNEELGLQVFEELKNEFGGNKVMFLKVDVSDKNQFEDAFKKTIEKFNNIDVLVNNAGIFNERDWEKAVAVNVLYGLFQKSQIIGNLLGFETYIPKYKSGSLGVIVNVCSIGSLEISNFGPIYTSTKWGALGLSRSFGVKEHFERTKVKVIAICPGSTASNIRSALETLTLNEHYAKSFEKFRTTIVQQQPSKHVAVGVVNLLQHANSGSVWVIENSEEPYELEFPTRQQMRKKK